MIFPPYLTNLSMKPDIQTGDSFPTNLPLFSSGLFNLQINRPISIIVGENGSGKSTILEAIAKHCGFSLAGGNANHLTHRSEDSSELSAILRFSWKIKPRGGFFLRAETLQEFGAYLDEMADEYGDAIAYAGYGGKSLRKQSHGEGYLGILQSRLDTKGLVLLDEPEAALSPNKQMQLLALLGEAEKENKAQVIIATHSPIIMSYPNAQLFEIYEGGLEEKSYKETEHYRLYARFLADPEKYHQLILG